MTPLEDAQAFVLGSCPPLGAIDVDRTDASGLVLAAPVVAGEVVPPFDNSAVDGYAVRAADVADAPVELRVIGELAAGAAPSRSLGAREAIRIMTGAPLPFGAAAIVMVEDSERIGDDAVRLLRSVPVGAAIRRAGDDVRVGDVLFDAGTIVSPPVAGVLASVNAQRVTVHRRAVVAVLSTGDELVDHLARQKALLDERLEVMERQREALRNAWEAARMGINLGPEERLEVFGAHDPGQYADEARERWGETDAYRESHRRTSEYTKADWQRLGEESERIEQEYADCLMSGEPSDGPRARAAAERHRSHIDQWFYPCSHEMQVGLAEMYVADPRFTAHYDARVPGLAQYVHEAIYANALADGT